MELPPSLFSDVIEYAHRYANASGPEKRNVKRLEMSLPTRISRVVQGVVEPPVLVVLRDISPSGIGFIHSEAMKAGDQIIAWLPRPDAEPAKVHCVVTRWHPLGEELFVIGAMFDRVEE